MKVAQVFADHAKVKLPFDGGLVEHEAAVVKIMTYLDFIRPNSRGGPTRLQECIISAMPLECKGARDLIEMQCELTLQTTGYYPNSTTLLKIVSPFIHKRLLEHAQTHVIETTQKPKRERPPGDEVFTCANCLGAHASAKCPYKCSICGTAYCGAAIVGRTCAVAEKQFPPTVLDAKGKPIPDFLHKRLKGKHVARHKGGGSSE